MKYWPCRWTYRGAECGYTGDAVATSLDTPTSDLTLDQCSHSVAGCKLRFGANLADLPFGGFPSVSEANDAPAGPNITEPKMNATYYVPQADYERVQRENADLAAALSDMLAAVDGQRIYAFSVEPARQLLVERLKGITCRLLSRQEIDRLFDPRFNTTIPGR